ncbi:diguanylate cyclase (GGDEF) domain-containing protein [Synechococcus sp. PCC 7502]|uniref:EAL domain-containing protein n=1 Tax=Synechococcus sp. PCC 7502 TaxID=1173263 RepID=UPI00029FAC5D|nr:EAL domain-containing protein [Synechococcus sp. PCC 7502]AFY74706.1 diguanylate cyclase (GGDEF) domain-containing protein [Synechococcus sp. PCC 7502]
MKSQTSQSKFQGKAQPKFKVSLSAFLVIPFLLQIFAIVGVIGWLSFRNGQTAVNEVASELRNGISEHIKDQMESYIALPPLINQITANAIATGQIDLNNEEILSRHLWKQIVTFPTTTFHYIGKTNGEFYTARRFPSGQVATGVANSSTNQQIDYFSTDQNGDRLQLLETVPNRFDPRSRPWYKTAIATGKPTWTKIYRHFVTKGLTISAAQPVYGQSGNLVGVVSTDFVFLRINEFLRSLKIGKSGQTFIMEKSGALISTSTDDPIFTIQGSTTDRLFAQASKNEIMRQSAQKLLQQKDDLNPKNPKEFELNIAGAKYFAQVSPLTDSMGIDWLIVVVVPESDFMDKIQQNTQSTVALCAIALATSAIIGTLVARKIAKPILNLSTAVSNLANHEDAVIIPEEGIEELQVLARSFNTMANRLESTFIDLHHSAYHDPLTNLPNRSAFIYSLENRIARRQVEPDYLFALLFLDLDRFKLVNDSLGHLIGDLLLIAVTKRLQSCLRKTDMISRFGGDEFIILLNEIPNIEFANHFAERIQKSLNQPFEIEGHQIYTSTSIGIVSPLNSTGSPQDLLRDADIALYQAKQDGKACSKIFDAAMHDRANALLELETDLRRAIALPINIEEFVVYYQPIVKISNLEVVGCEALIRWNHPTRGLLNPGLFLSVAEDMGAIATIDLWVLRQACVQMQTWLKSHRHISLKQVSVNLSSLLFLQPNWMQYIYQILEETGLEPKHLKLELVESTLMDSTDATRVGLEKLRSAGISLDIDDFGTGYSSLSYLCRFPLDTIKIDRSFIISLEKENLEIVKAVILLAQNLNMQTVAEGVETVGQLEILRKLGCDRAQGYFFSPPVPAEEIIRLF